MARGKSTSWETSKPLSHRARALIERDPEAVAEIVSRAKPGRAAVTGVFLSKRSAAKAAVMTALSGQTFPVRRGKAAVVKSTKKPVRTGRNADVVNIDAVPLSDPEPIPERLRRFLTAPDGVDAFVSATEAARRLGIARGTVYAWIDEGLLLGWRQTGQGLFIPAEQIRGARGVGPVSDQWALGAVTWECLTGAKLFSATALYELFQLIMEMPIPDLRALRRHHPAHRAGPALDLLLPALPEALRP